MNEFDATFVFKMLRVRISGLPADMSSTMVARPLATLSTTVARRCLLRHLTTTMSLTSLTTMLNNGFWNAMDEFDAHICRCFVENVCYAI